MPATNNQAVGITQQALQQQWETLNQMMSNPNIKENFASAIPFAYSLFGSYVINPSVVSPETYFRMSHTDPVIFASQTYNIQAIVSTIGDYIHPNPKITEFMRDRINILDRPFQEILTDVLSDTICFGHSCTQMVDYKNRYIYDFVSMPPNTVLYQIDVKGKLLQRGGINQYYLNYLYGNTAQQLSYQGFDSSGYQTSPDPWSADGDAVIPLRSLLTNNFFVVPFDKSQIIHFALNGIRATGNPYGISPNRISYNAYLSKQALLQFMLLKAYKSSNPTLLAYVNTQQPVKDFQGNRVDPIKALNDQFMMDKGNNIIIAPGKKGSVYEFDKVDLTTDLEMYIKIMNALNREIMLSQWVPDTIFGGGEGGSYALGISQQSTSNIMLTGTRRKLIDTILNTYVRWNLENNFTFNEYKTLGDFKTKERSLDEQRKALENIEILNTMGLIDRSNNVDQNIIREIADLPGIDGIIQNIEQERINKEGGASVGRPSDLTHSVKTTEKSIHKPYNHWDKGVI